MKKQGSQLCLVSCHCHSLSSPPRLPIGSESVREVLRGTSFLFFCLCICCRCLLPSLIPVSNGSSRPPCQAKQSMLDLPPGDRCCIPLGNARSGGCSGRRPADSSGPTCGGAAGCIWPRPTRRSQGSRWRLHPPVCNTSWGAGVALCGWLVWGDSRRERLPLVERYTTVGFGGKKKTEGKSAGYPLLKAHSWST